MNSFLILVGMMGSGKTTVGRKLAEALDVPFMDTDQLLQNRLGRPIHQLFQIYGETAFRMHETKVLEALEPQEAVLATGGGIVVKDENWVELRRLGTTIFLDASLEVLTTRLATAKKRRPLLEVPEWESKVQEIRDRRMELYRKADITISVERDDFDDVILKICEAVPWS